MFTPPRNDLAYSMAKLDKILSRRRLSFNPYTVSDTRLLEIVAQTGWGNVDDIVQIVTLRFMRLNKVADQRGFNGVYIRVGMSDEDVVLASGPLYHGITASDTLQPERTWIGSKPLRHPEDVERLVGKRVFVSRIIRGKTINGNPKVAYKMYSLRGNIAKDAETIRKAMIAAKIEMLERILEHPEADIHLSCRKDLFDYSTRIHQAIEVITRFPDHLPPPDYNPS